MFFAAVENPTSVADKLALGGNTTLIGMSIVFLVLIALWLIIVVEHKIIEGVQSAYKKNEPAKVETAAPAPVSTAVPVQEKCGKSNGETEITADVDDETTAVILASVSEHTSIPMDELKIKSIKGL